jgi:hypothetical protein
MKGGPAIATRQPTCSAWDEAAAEWINNLGAPTAKVGIPRELHAESAPARPNDLRPVRFVSVRRGPSANRKSGRRIEGSGTLEISGGYYSPQLARLPGIPLRLCELSLRSGPQLGNMGRLRAAYPKAAQGPPAEEPQLR